MEKVYETDDIRVFWYPEKCSHSARCLNGLPQVFDLGQRPWVNVQAASGESILRTIDTCPSGALKYDLTVDSKLASELARGPGWVGYQAQTALLKIKVLRDGPLVLDGQFEMVDATGGLLEQGSKATLCRCGLSGKKPYCDGNHFRQGWKE